MAANVVHVAYTEEAAQLLGRNLHRSWGRRLARLGLRERRRSSGMESDVALNFLHGLVNVSVQHRNRAKALQVRECLSAVSGSPSPFRIDAPQWYVGKDHNGRALGKMLDVSFHPLQLFLTQAAKATGLKVHHVYQPDEVHALLIEAVPAGALRAFAVALQVLLAIVADHVMLARNVKDIFGAGALKDLLYVIELFRLGKVTDIAGMQDEAWFRGQGIDLDRKS